MAVQRLVLDTLKDDDYELIAIHSSLPSYRLAFLLNKTLNLKLFRKKEDIYFEYTDLIANFPIYQYEDHFQYSTYNLLGNKFKSKIASKKSIPNGLFTETQDIYATKYLIPELKNVDYFLKIDTESSTLQSKAVIVKILAISQVITAYDVAYETLKSKNNLIFE